MVLPRELLDRVLGEYTLKLPVDYVGSLDDKEARDCEYRLGVSVLQSCRLVCRRWYRHLKLLAESSQVIHVRSKPGAQKLLSEHPVLLRRARHIVFHHRDTQRAPKAHKMMEVLQACESLKTVHVLADCTSSFDTSPLYNALQAGPAMRKVRRVTLVIASATNPLPFVIDLLRLFPNVRNLQLRFGCEVKADEAMDSRRVTLNKLERVTVTGMDMRGTDSRGRGVRSRRLLQHIMTPQSEQQLREIITDDVDFMLGNQDERPRNAFEHLQAIKVIESARIQQSMNSVDLAVLNNISSLRFVDYSSRLSAAQEFDEIIKELPPSVEYLTTLVRGDSLFTLRDRELIITKIALSRLRYLCLLVVFRNTFDDMHLLEQRADETLRIFFDSMGVKLQLEFCRVSQKESYRAGWYESEDLPRRYRRRLARPMGDQAEWNMLDAVYDSHYPDADSFTPTTSDPADRIFGRRMTSSSWFLFLLCCASSSDNERGGLSAAHFDASRHDLFFFHARIDTQMRATHFPVELWPLVFRHVARSPPCDLHKQPKSACATRRAYFDSIRRLKAIVLTCTAFNVACYDLLWLNAMVRVSTVAQYVRLVKLNPRFLRSVGHLVFTVNEDVDSIGSQEVLCLLAKCRRVTQVHLVAVALSNWNQSLLRDLQSSSALHNVRRATLNITADEIELSVVTSFLSVMPNLDTIELELDGDTFVDPSTQPLHFSRLQKLVLDGLFVEEGDWDLEHLFDAKTLNQIEWIRTDHACRFKDACQIGQLLSNLREIVIKNSSKFTTCPVAISQFAGLKNLEVLDLEDCGTANEPFMDIIRDVPPSVVKLRTGVFVKGLADVDLVAVTRALKRKSLAEALLIGTFNGSGEYFTLNDRDIVRLVRRLKLHTGVRCTLRLPSVAFKDASRAANRAYPDADFDSMTYEEQNVLLANLSTVDFDFSPRSKRKRVVKGKLKSVQLDGEKAVERRRKSRSMSSSPPSLKSSP